MLITPNKPYKMQIDQGANFGDSLTLLDIENNPIDLTGWAGRCQIRPKPESSSFYPITVTIADPPSSGVILLALTAVQTSAIRCLQNRGATLKPTPYVYNIEMVKPNGTVIRILQGVAEVSPDVTR